jgi:membrane fusion protein, multidrug efflux system
MESRKEIIMIIKNLNMKLKGRLFSISGIVLMVFALFSCSSATDGVPGEQSSGAPDWEEAVRVMELQHSEISRSITNTANLQAFREVHLASASPGRIDRIHVETGTRVSQGQLLVELDRTRLQQAQLQLESLEKDFRRLDTLRSVGSIPRQQFDQIKTQYDLALSNVEFLKDNTRLLAPFSGVVSGKYYENGEMFSGAPNTPAGKAAILSIVQTTQLKAMVNISEQYYPRITTGMPVVLTSDVWPREEFKGTVLRVYPTIDPLTRTFTIELAVPNRDERLRPGMFARARLDLEQVEVFVVPALAVLKLQGSNERFVFIEKDGRAKRVVVELGDRFDDMVEIVTDRVQAGDNLIIAGQARLLDGVAVSVN